MVFIFRMIFRLYNELFIYVIAFGVYNSKQVKSSGITIFRAQFLALYLHKVMLNAANILFNCLELYTPNANIYTGLLSSR